MVGSEVTLFRALRDSCPCEKRGIPNGSRSGAVARNRVLELGGRCCGAMQSAVSAGLRAHEGRR